MKVLKVFICNFQIIATTKICITFYQVTPCITPYHALSLVITPYRLGWKQNHFHLATLKLVSRPQSFYHILCLVTLITPYHTLSPNLETKPFSFGNFKISSQDPYFLIHLITPCHSLSHFITPYPLGWKQNHFHLTTLKLVSRPQIFYCILSRLVTPDNSLTHLILQVGNKTIFIWQL